MTHNIGGCLTQSQSKDMFLLLRVPQEVQERAESPIVLPGEEPRGR